MARRDFELRPTWDMELGYKNASQGELKLLDLLVSKRRFAATDARDKVYAVAGIASESYAGNQLSITYEKSPALVYME